VMWSQSLRDPAYAHRLDQLRQELRGRLGPEVEIPEQPRGPWEAGEAEPA
jgi:hypothetical protein